MNGHGAVNHLETIDRLSKDFSHTTDCLVVWQLAIPNDILKDGSAGHADIYETSMMLFYQKFYDSNSIVDFSTLPRKNVPIHYPDFSIVDGAGFSKSPDPEKIVRNDPRDANEDLGKELFEKTVKNFIGLMEEALRGKGLLWTNAFLRGEYNPQIILRKTSLYWWEDHQEYAENIVDNLDVLEEEGLMFLKSFVGPV